MRKLYKHQEEAERKLVEYKRFGVFHDLGLGKTTTALSGVQTLGREAIVVCPETAKLSWLAELQYFKDISDLKLYNYTTFQKLSKEDVKDKILIFDEAHALKHNSTKRTKFALNLSMYVYKVWLLTGTPIADKPLDLFMLLVFLGRRTPEEFYSFRNKYCVLIRKKFGHKRFIKVVGYKNLNALKEELKDVSDYKKLSQCFDLPAANFIPQFIVLNREERAAYTEWYKDPDIHSMTLLHDFSFKIIVPRAKELIKNLLATTEEKIVVFSNYIDTVKELSMYLNFPAILGELSLDQRKVALDRFSKERGLVATYPTGAASLNLQAASYEVLVDLPYYFLDFKQALGRIYRNGQTKPTFFYMLIPKDTILEEVYNTLYSKYSWTKKIFDEDTQWDILRYLDKLRKEGKLMFK